MSFVIRLGAGTVIAIWTAICAALYLVIELFGEALIGMLGGPVGSLLGFLHDVGMVLLVFIWVVVAWSIWALAKAAGGSR